MTEIAPLFLSYFTNFTLRRKIGLLVILGLVVVFAAFGSLSLWSQNESTQRSLQERLLLAQVTARQIDRYLSQVLAELQEAAASSSTSPGSRTLDSIQQALRQIYPRLKIFVNEVFFLDERGVVIWAEPASTMNVGSSLADIVPAKRIYQTGMPYISGVVLGWNQKPLVYFATPVRDKNGDVAGLIAGSADLSLPGIGGFIEAIKLGKTGYAQIVDGRGLVVASTEPVEVFGSSDHGERFVTLIEEQKAVVRTCHSCHESGEAIQRRRDVMAFAPLSVTSWGVAVRQSEEEALEPTRRLEAGMIVVGSVSLGLALLLTLVTTGRILRPVDMLTKAAQRISGGDLTTSIVPLGKDEIGTLAHTFDTMRERLKVSRDEIEQWNEELEQRVQRRTGELSALFEMAKTLTTTMDLDSLLRVVAGRTVELFEGARGGALLLYDKNLHKLVVRSTYGLGLESSEMKVDPDHGILARIYHSGKGEIFSMAQELKGPAPETGLSSLAQLAEVGKWKWVMGVPLISKGVVIGCLFLVHADTDPPFTDPELRLLQAMADEISLAIENALLMKEAEQVRALQEADKLKSEFISTVSHELRTPLTSIKGYTTTLLRKDVRWDEDTKLEFLQIIDEESDNLRELIDNLLEMSKMEAGFLKMERQPALIAHIAQKAVEDIRPRSKRHEFVLDFPPHFPVVEADPRRIEQVLHNLLENAIKYSSEGSQVIVRGSTDGSQVVIGVSDRGVGILPEHLDKVFDRFYRVESDLTRRMAGSGLGLSIARRIMEAHGGRIWVESTVGKGSTFFFTIPLSLSVGLGKDGIAASGAGENEDETNPHFTG